MLWKSKSHTRLWAPFMKSLCIWQIIRTHFCRLFSSIQPWKVDCSSIYICVLTQACLRENATVWNLLYKFMGLFDCHCLFDTFDIPGKLLLPKKPRIFNKVVFLCVSQLSPFKMQRSLSTMMVQVYEVFLQIASSISGIFSCRWFEFVIKVCIYVMKLLINEKSVLNK